MEYTTCCEHVTHALVYWQYIIECKCTDRWKIYIIGTCYSVYVHVVAMLSLEMLYVDDCSSDFKL